MKSTIPKAKSKITSKTIESLPNYVGAVHSHILSSLMTGKEYKDKWRYIHKGNEMKITKGDKLSWEEVLKIVRDEVIRHKRNRNKIRK